MSNQLHKHMSISVYLSDVSPWWTMKRQEAALADVLPKATVFRDELEVRARRRHQAADLVRRQAMLRPTTRHTDGETIHVASYAVLAWSEDDMREVLAAIDARGASLVSVDDGPTEDVIAVWKRARVKSRLAGASELGAAISAERRKAASLAGVALIRPYWPLPSKEYPTVELETRSGLSLNTIKAHLGPRPIAQYNHREKMKRRARKEAQTA